MVEVGPVRSISLPQTSDVGCDETKRANGFWDSELHVLSLPWVRAVLFCWCSRTPLEERLGSQHEGGVMRVNIYIYLLLYVRYDDNNNSDDDRII